MGQPRKRTSSDRPYANRFLAVRRDEYEDGGSRELTRTAFVVEVPDWVNVVAVDDGGRVVMVTQFRFGTRQESLEIPGGGVDEGETALEAARRELREETGFEAADWLEVGVVEPNPAIQGNRCTTFVARGLSRVGEPDPDEIDSVVLMPLDDVLAGIDRGEIRHALVIAGMHLALRALAREGEATAR